jgi:cytochrome P450
VFDVERWLRPGMMNTGGAKSNSSFMTFGQGPRSCIGKSFARGEIYCVIACIVGRFSLELQDPETLVTGITMGASLKPKPDVKVKLTPVEGW